MTEEDRRDFTTRVLADKVARRLAQLIVGQLAKVCLVLLDMLRELMPAIRDLQIVVIAFGGGIVAMSFSRDEQTRHVVLGGDCGPLLQPPVDGTNRRGPQFPFAVDARLVPNAKHPT